MRQECGFVFAALCLAGCCAGEKKDAVRLKEARTFAEAEVAIERMRKEETADWAAIREQFEKCLPVVRRVDAEHSTSYVEEIGRALDKCAAGDKAGVNQQILAKGLQHVAALAIKSELDIAMGNGADADGAVGAVEYAAALFEGIRPTFVRRDADFFGGAGTLEKAADEAVQHLREAAGSGKGGILAARRELDDAITRTYALSVLYEIQGIEELRDKDLAKCEVKRVEALVFYRIIKPLVRKRDGKADEVICAMLEGDYAAMSSQVIEENLEKGLLHINLR